MKRMQNERGWGKKKKKHRQGAEKFHFISTSLITPWCSPSQEVNSSSASHKIPHILQNLKVHYCVHKNMPLVPIMSHINTFHALPVNLRPISILSSHLCIRLPNSIFGPGFPTKTLYVLLFCPTQVTFPPTILRDLIKGIIISDGYKS